jgi:hypothetical protein
MFLCNLFLFGTSWIPLARVKSIYQKVKTGRRKHDYNGNTGGEPRRGRMSQENDYTNRKRTEDKQTK